MNEFEIFGGLILLGLIFIGVCVLLYKQHKGPPFVATVAVDAQKVLDDIKAVYDKHTGAKQ